MNSLLRFLVDCLVILAAVLSFSAFAVLGAFALLALVVGGALAWVFCGFWRLTRFG